MALTPFLGCFSSQRTTGLNNITIIVHRPHICHKYHKLYLWRKICQVEKFQISVKNLNNVWSFIEIYAVFDLNLCGENLRGEKNDKYEVYLYVHSTQA